MSTINIELTEIMNQFKEVIRHSQGIPEPKVEELFNQWAEAKSDIIHYILGNQLTLELGRVSYDIAAEAKKTKVSMFVNWLDQFYPTTQSLMEFISSMPPEEFYTNHLSNDYFFDDKKINKGTKIIKAFKHFISSEDLLEAIQNKASELIQENKITGDLVLSVHPLDFLSLSENTSRWRSCHALDGEYRAGNLSYMLDKTTIIAYLRGEGGETHQLPNFPASVLWNNKKWRCLFFLEDSNHSSIIFAGRPYPMAIDGILDSVRSALIARMETRGWWSIPKWTEWSSDTISTVKIGETEKDVHGCYYYLSGQIFHNKTLIKDAKDSRHYNDLLYSSCYTPKYIYDETANIGSKTRLRIGSACNCLRCGQKHIETKDTMMCTDCECEYGESESSEYSHCDYCGARRPDNEMREVDGSWICPNCYEQHTFTCGCCGQRFPIHQQKYSEVRQEFVCEYCLEREQQNSTYTISNISSIELRDAANHQLIQTFDIDQNQTFISITDAIRSPIENHPIYTEWLNHRTERTDN